MITMLSVGDGIAIFGVLGTIIVALFGYFKIRNGKNEKYVRADLCALRHGKLDEDIQEIKSDVKTILKHLKM